MTHPIIHKANLIFDSLSRYEDPESVLFESVGVCSSHHHRCALLLAWARLRHLDYGLPMELPYVLESDSYCVSAWKTILALPDALKVTRNSGTWSGGSEGVKAQGKGLDRVVVRDKLITNYAIVPPSDAARKQASEARLPYQGIRRVVDREKCRVFDNKRGLHF